MFRYPKGRFNADVEPKEQCLAELAESKRWLEDVIGKLEDGNWKMEAVQ
jgi:hypothetical protein